MLATWGCSTFPKPTLSLDFAGATSLDDRITFTRGSQATLFDSTGTLVYAKHNLALQSEDFSTTWAVVGTASVLTNQIDSPNGTLTADKFVIGSTITSGNAALSQASISKPAAVQTYTVSLYIKNGGFNSLRVILRDNASASNFVQAYFNSELGTIAQAANAGGTFSNASAAIENAGNGWYRVSVTGTTSTETSLNIRLLNYINGTSTATGDGTSGIFIWGAQLNLANMEGGVTSSLTTYYPTTTAAYYAPRFDYSPSTLQPLGLLIEEARTNLLLQSQTFQTTWTATRSSISADSITAPDGTLTGDTFVEDTTASNSHRLSQTFSATSGTTYTASVFVKAQSTRCLRIVFATAFASDAATINPVNGATQVNSGTTATSVADVGNGWYRFTVSATATSTATASIEFYTTVGLNTSVSYTGNGTSGVYIWGAQLEAGAFATSYIPTTTTALTRSADVASMTGTNFSSWYNASEGTVYAEASSAVGGGTAQRRIVVFNDGTTSNQTTLRFGADMASAAFTVTTSGSLVVGISSSAALTQNTFYKNAGAYEVDDYAFALSGSLIGTDTSGALPTVNVARIGGSTTGEYLNGHIRRIAYYPARLPNTTLQALTA